MKTQKRRLMWHGMLLFLLGLITGLLEQRFTNVRMVSKTEFQCT
jgi:(hydroxyamino)benzene mutase